jgi:hypothetical protein
MKIGGRTMPFCGGGHLRFFPLRLIRFGFNQNLDAGRPCMSYIHPREIDREQPRMDLPPVKYFKYYFGISSAKPKLQAIMSIYMFDTISAAMERVRDLKQFKLEGGAIVPS